MTERNEESPVISADSLKLPGDTSLAQCAYSPYLLEIKRYYLIDSSFNEISIMFTHVWYWKSRLPERKDQLCKILARGKMNSILVEFADGFKVITSRYAVRKVKLQSKL